MKKSYKDFNKTYIGCSDRATLTMVEEEGKSEFLYFGEDGDYAAYIVSGEAVIGKHYKKIATFKNKLEIHDDDGISYVAEGTTIHVYRAGEFGCIIQILS